MKYISLFLAVLFIAATGTILHSTPKKSADELTHLLQRFVTLKYRHLGWKQFSAKMVAALSNNDRYSHFVNQLKFYSDICKSDVSRRSISKRALMLREYREDLPDHARHILDELTWQELLTVVRLYTEVDAESTGCEIVD